MNPYGDNTLRGWFFSAGYLYILVAAIVALGFFVRSIDLKSVTVTRPDVISDDARGTQPD